MHGINHTDIGADDKIISAASCTTNAIVPVLKAVNDQYGIVNGHVETVHSYTNDQNLIDNFHKGSRRGRSAPLNMVITETGAATAAAKALPVLKGKLTGNAIRVPTPNVSMAILNLNLEKATTREEINEYLRQMAMHSDLQKQIDFVSSQEVVSTDFVGSRHAGVVDAEATICNDNRVVLYVWYDNEFGYSCQVVRVMEDMAGVNPPAFRVDAQGVEENRSSQAPVFILWITRDKETTHFDLGFFNGWSASAPGRAEAWPEESPHPVDRAGQGDRHRAVPRLGGRHQDGRPVMILGYAIGGFIAFLIMRQLGRDDRRGAGGRLLQSLRAHKYWGGFAGFLSGWNYWVLYILVGMSG